MCFCVYNKKYRNMSAAGSDSDAETVITEGTIERGKGSKEKETLGKVSQITFFIGFWANMADGRACRIRACRTPGACAAALGLLASRVHHAALILHSPIALKTQQTH